MSTPLELPVYNSSARPPVLRAGERAPLCELVYWVAPGATAIVAHVRAQGTGTVRLEIDGAVAASATPSGGDLSLSGALTGQSAIALRLVADGGALQAPGLPGVPTLTIEGFQVNCLAVPPA